MKRKTLLLLVLSLALCLAACAKPGTVTHTPDTATHAPNATADAPNATADAPNATADAPETDGDVSATERFPTDRIPFACPEGYTDPLTITVDASTLARADGKVLDWDAAAEPPTDTTDGQPTAFDASTWPDNEYTAHLPLPPSGSVAMSGEDEEAAGTYSIVFDNLPYDGFLAYVEQIKAAGFTNNAHTEDYAQYGMEGMSYGASEASGRTVELIYSGGMAYMMVSLG